MTLRWRERRISPSTFFEANNSSIPGTKVCTDAAVPANRSFQFSIGAQCSLAVGSHFGVLVVSDSANPQGNSFYGYTRVQNPLGIGFSVEGFPVQNFNNQVSHATGLKRQAASPTYQTNCFVGSLDQPVSYELKLFNDATGAQIGNTLTGSLGAFQQYRYLDVFGPNGVNVAGDQLNVRAQFTQTSGGTANLIGFCTVQDNTSFGADFRIAKSYGSPSNSFFAQGGNAFGTLAALGTLDNNPLEIFVNNALSWRLVPDVSGISNIIVGGYGGASGNTFTSGASGAVIGGGGANGSTLYTLDCTRPCRNRVTDAFGTVGGGAANIAGDDAGSATNAAFATVAGGLANTASASFATVGGGGNNTAVGLAATVVGGLHNTASGDYAVVANGLYNTATGDYSFAAGNGAFIPASAYGTFLWASRPASLPEGTNESFYVVAPNGIGMYTYTDFSHGCALVGAASSWTCTSDRATKSDFTAIEPRDVLARLVAMPISQWRWKGESETVRHMGPVAQDFRAAFGLGYDDKTITLVDTEGVALAAIQGLHQLMQEKDAEIAELREAVAELKRDVEALTAK